MHIKTCTQLHNFYRKATYVSKCHTHASAMIHYVCAYEYGHICVKGICLDLNNYVHVVSVFEFLPFCDYLARIPFDSFHKLCFIISHRACM